MSQNNHPELQEGKMTRPQIKLVQGVPMADWLADNWAKVSLFQAKPDDLLIATYPKAGTTWMQEIVDLISCKGDAKMSKRAPIYERIPFLELIRQGLPVGLQLIEKMPSPRIMKSHLPVQLIPKSFWEQDCKVIVVARNAKDNMVSYFHFIQMNQKMPESGKWEEFLQNFMNGQVAWGSWYDHVNGWWEAKDKRRILYLFYEDMKENPRREILKVAKFMEKVLEEDIIDKVVELSSFSVMKENPMTNFSTLSNTIFDQRISRFMRKGEVGDWKNHFTVAQNEAFEKDYENQMGRSSMKFRDVL